MDVDPDLIRALQIVDDNEREEDDPGRRPEQEERVDPRGEQNSEGSGSGGNDKEDGRTKESVIGAEDEGDDDGGSDAPKNNDDEGRDEGTESPRPKKRLRRIVLDSPSQGPDPQVVNVNPSQAIPLRSWPMRSLGQSRFGETKLLTLMNIWIKLTSWFSKRLTVISCSAITSLPCTTMLCGVL